VFAENISQILVPTEKVYTTRAGKKVLKEKVMFSGYVFVKLELTGEIEATLQDTTNVVNFVRNREGERRPEPVPEHQILTMLGKAEEREMEAADAISDYVVGESVKVNFGPFSGFIGEIKEINQEKRELTVMVKVFGRETPLKLDNSQVERE
jgi:transcriptional antiterminator NusG